MPDLLLRPAVESWVFPRSVASVALLVRFAEEHGIGRDELISQDVPVPLDDPDAQVDAHVELAVIRGLVRLLGDRPGLGVEVGRRYRVATFGVLGFACLSSPTLRDAVVFALRYLDLSFAFCIPRVTVADGETRMVMDDSRVPADTRAFLVERDLTAIRTVMGDLLGAPLELRGLDFRAPEPADLRIYREEFGLRPNFGRPVNLTVTDAGYLDRPLPQANEQTVAMCEAQCRRLITRRRARVGIAHEVRQRLVSVGGAPAGIDDVARDLAMSVRTLRRRLTEAGTSYRRLLDEVRHALAEELLSTGALSVEDVAIRLGYAEASSFIHAFKRWTGSTPTSVVRGSAVRVRRGG